MIPTRLERAHHGRHGRPESHQLPHDRKLQASESLKSMLLSLLGLILLFALSFGGALAAFYRKFEGLG